MTTEYLDQSTQEDGAPVDSATEPILEAVHLRKYFPLSKFKISGPRDMAHAVEDTSLTLFASRALALVGESGSGKTTVARMLARLYEPTAGTITYRGVPIKDSTLSRLRTYRRHIQLIFQDPFASLNPAHSVKYHLSRPLRIYGHAHNAH